MVKITALYRWFEGAQFDHAYYQTEHMRIAHDALRPLGLLRLESEQNLQPAPLKAGQVVAATNACFATDAIAQEALAQTGALMRADLPRYTNIRPEMYLSEVKSHHSNNEQERT